MGAKRLLALLDRLGCGVLAVGADGRIDLVSVKARVFAGLAPSEAVPGLRAYLVRLLGSDAHAEIDRAGTEADWLQALASLDDKGLTLSAADRRWYHLTADPAGGVVTIFDVTAMKRRELLLTELHERLAGEGQNLKRFAQDLAIARSAAAEALRRQEQANLALEREIAERRQLETELRRLADTPTRSPTASTGVAFSKSSTSRSSAATRPG